MKSYRTLNFGVSQPARVSYYLNVKVKDSNSIYKKKLIFKWNFNTQYIPRTTHVYGVN